MKHTYTDEQVITAVTSSISYAEILRKLGAYGPSGSAYTNLKRRIAGLGLPTDHLLGQRHGGSNIRLPGETLVLRDRLDPKTDHKTLRRALKTLGRADECAICGNTGEWLGKPLRLHIDHVNGLSYDNRADNLRYLCPNCHDQTETWGNSKRI